MGYFYTSPWISPLSYFYPAGNDQTGHRAHSSESYHSFCQFMYSSLVQLSVLY